MINKQTFSGIILLIILLVPTFHMKAQEKQNDATWEETVDFLKENLPRLDRTAQPPLQTINIEDNHLKIKNDLAHNTWYYEVDLENFQDFQIENSKSRSNETDIYYILNFEKKTVRRTYSNLNKSDIFSEMVIRLCWGNQCDLNDIKNTKLINRLSKAFEHLAYLAEEKRKESKF